MSLRTPRGTRTRTRTPGRIPLVYLTNTVCQIRRLLRRARGTVGGAGYVNTTNEPSSNKWCLSDKIMNLYKIDFPTFVALS
jgi:hypothetical protein